MPFCAHFLPLVNYRHHFHAGNFADVMKHALLVQLARALQRKQKGVLYLDTHAGRGFYDLERAATGQTLERVPEHPGGIGRLLSGGGLPAQLEDYLALVRSFDERMRRAEPAQTELQFYPGSPEILRLLARPQDRLSFWEMQPEEAAALRGEFGGASRISVSSGNGYGALRAELPPPERRALVLIDPPYETPEEWPKIVKALGEGLRRFPSGVYAVWYPLTERAGADAIDEIIRELPLPPTLLAELVVNPGSDGLKGCGLMILNPPWQFEKEADPLLCALSQMLAQAPGGAASLRWLVPE